MLPTYQQKPTDRVGHTVVKQSSAAVAPAVLLAALTKAVWPHAPSPPTLSRLRSLSLALLALFGSCSVPFWEPTRDSETCMHYQRRADVDAFGCQPRSLDCIGAASAPHCVTLGVAAPSAPHCPHAPFAYVIRPPPLTYARPRAHAQRCATHVLHTAMRACLHAHERHACICTSDAADAQARGDRRLTCPSISSQRARGINAAEHLVPSSTCFTTSIVLSTVRIDTRGYLCVCVIDRHQRRSTRSGLPRVCVCMLGVCVWYVTCVCVCTHTPLADEISNRSLAVFDVSGHAED